ncbi:MAG TPA: dienelactone hydrolase family protein [Cytophagales bacterium]|nr:dienelactone hydrolase family protein [Cytophagales bacterium]
MHEKRIITGGRKLADATKALIMIHGRGASAEDILSIARHLNVKDYALFAPEATNNTWYPYSFLAPPTQNEPKLSSALSILNEIVDDINEGGIASENIYFLGFSQGACLTLEFTTRNARKWGGVVAFTGGLIGDKIYPDNYKGDFENTPIFIGTSNPDPHVPVERVNETTKILKQLHASITEKVYQNMGHTISQDEIELANKLVFTN